ncbi:MAG TPA: hypothetical protein VI248_04525 [Kineosporiaceae bacterium]
MSHARPLRLRPLLLPLGAMLTIAAVAGYLVAREPAPVGRPEPGRSDLAPVAATLHGTLPARSGPAARRTGARSRRGTVTPTSKLYRFLLMQPDGGTPIRWNPCRPIHYRISLGGLVPPGEVSRVRAAFATAGAALGGVRFVDDGITPVVPDTVDDAGRAGVDIVFAFALPGSGPKRSALLSGWEAGRGGFAAAGEPGSTDTVVERPTHGSVVIDAAKWRDMTRHDRTVLYLHEIGHVVGLDHPADGHQIMSSGAYNLPARYQKGDLAGLARLGLAAGCAP